MTGDDQEKKSPWARKLSPEEKKFQEELLNKKDQKNNLLIERVKKYAIHPSLKWSQQF